MNVHTAAGTTAMLIDESTEVESSDENDDDDEEGGGGRITEEQQQQYSECEQWIVVLEKALVALDKLDGLFICDESTDSTSKHQSYLDFIETIAELSDSVSTIYRNLIRYNFTITSIGTTTTMVGLSDYQFNLIASMIKEIYFKIESIFFVKSQLPAFTRIIQFSLKGEDVVRKISLRSHLFWELCRLRYCAKGLINLNDYTQNMMHETKHTYSFYCSGDVCDTFADDIDFDSDDDDNNNNDNDDSESDNDYGSFLNRFESTLSIGVKKVTSSTTMDAASYFSHVGKPIGKLSQKELNVCFYKLSKYWKTMDYTRGLANYVETLMDRVAEYFCYSMTEEEGFNDPELRQPAATNLSQQQQQPHHQKQQHQQRHFAPNFDFLMMSQMRYYHFVSHLRVYDSFIKKDLNTSISWWLSKVYEVHGAGESSSSSSSSSSLGQCNVREWFSLHMLERHVSSLFPTATTDQKNSAAAKYVSCMFSECDREWLAYRPPLSLPSADLDEFVCQHCVGAEYGDIVKKNACKLGTIALRESKDRKRIGFYEWLIVRMTTNLFSQDFSLEERYAFSRTDMTRPGASIQITESKKPLLLQVFSRYYVYYNETLYVDNDNEINECQNATQQQQQQQQRRSPNHTIWKSLLLWMSIMMIDFPNSSKSKSIAEHMKRLFYEDFVYKIQRAATSKNAGNNNDRETMKINTLSEYDENKWKLFLGSSKLNDIGASLANRETTVRVEDSDFYFQNQFNIHQQHHTTDRTKGTNVITNTRDGGDDDVDGWLPFV